MTNVKSQRWIFIAIAIVALFAATGVAAMHTVPSLRDLISGHLLIDRVTLRRAYISAIGPKQDGRLRILPGMLDQAGHNDRAGLAADRRSHNATIGKVEFEDCTMELFDSTADGAQHRSRAIRAAYCLNSRHLRPAPRSAVAIDAESAAHHNRMHAPADPASR